ncbi:MAG: NADH-quinone oxidoreductase subunit NuoK [Coriobacteriia bacterium]|nr:NADH-quinone oxidoreductase subunit NuoK [Coriobacteriia bacterium]
MRVGLDAFLLLSAALFSIGIYGAISKKSTIGILMSLEIMSIAITLNLVAIDRFVTPAAMTGWFFALFMMVTSAAEIGIGLALVIAIFRAGKTSEVSDLTELKG